MEFNDKFTVNDFFAKIKDVSLKTIAKTLNFDVNKKISIPFTSSMKFIYNVIDMQTTMKYDDTGNDIQYAHSVDISIIVKDNEILSDIEHKDIIDCIVKNNMLGTYFIKRFEKNKIKNTKELICNIIYDSITESVIRYRDKNETVLEIIEMPESFCNKEAEPHTVLLD